MDDATATSLQQAVESLLEIAAGTGHLGRVLDDGTGVRAFRGLGQPERRHEGRGDDRQRVPDRLDHEALHGRHW